MQGSRGDEALQGLDTHEQMVVILAEQAKTYWKMWGPLGEPMVNGVEYWKSMQRTYILWLRQNAGNLP